MKSKQIKTYRKEQRHFTNKEKIEKYLTCSICQEIFDEPTRISCGHTFCKTCLEKWEKKSREGLCPLCRTKYIKRYTGKDLIALSIINDAMITCINSGCPWKGKLSDLDNHIQTCFFDPEKLPEFMKEEIDIKNVKTKKKSKIILDESEEEDCNNICSFNYTSSIKERVFNRDPSLVQKVLGEENNEKKDKEKIIKIKEKISDNDDVNELYNCLLFNNDTKIKSENKINNNNLKINIIDNKEKNEEKEKENISEKINIENEGHELHGSSIMNIFISPNITITHPDPNSFLNKKIDRNEN